MMSAHRLVVVWCFVVACSTIQTTEAISDPTIHHLDNNEILVEIEETATGCTDRYDKDTCGTALRQGRCQTEAVKTRCAKTCDLCHTNTLKESAAPQSDTIQAEIDMEIQAEEAAEQKAAGEAMKNEQESKKTPLDSQMLEAHSFLAKKESHKRRQAAEKASLQNEIDVEVKAEEQKEEADAVAPVEDADLTTQMNELSEDLEKETGKTGEEASDIHAKRQAAKAAKETHAAAVEQAKVHLQKAVGALKDSEKHLLSADRAADAKEKVADERETKAQVANIQREKDAGKLVSAEQTAEAQVESVVPAMRREIEKLHDIQAKEADLAKSEDNAMQTEQKDASQEAASIKREEATEEAQEAKVDQLQRTYGGTLAKAQNELESAEKGSITSHAAAELAKAAQTNTKADLQAADAKQIAALQTEKDAKEKIDGIRESVIADKAAAKLAIKQAKADSLAAKAGLREAVHQQSSLMGKDTATQAKDRRKLRAAESAERALEEKRNALARNDEKRDGAAQDMVLKARAAEMTAKKEANEVAKRLVAIEAQKTAAMKNATDTNKEVAQQDQELSEIEQKRRNLAHARVRVLTTKEKARVHLAQLRSSHQKLKKTLEEFRDKAAREHQKAEEDAKAVDKALSMESKKNALTLEVDALNTQTEATRTEVNAARDRVKEEIESASKNAEQDESMIQKQQKLWATYKNRTRLIQSHEAEKSVQIAKHTKTLDTLRNETTRLEKKLKGSSSSAQKTVFKVIQREVNHQTAGVQNRLNQELQAQNNIKQQLHDSKQAERVAHSDVAALETEEEVRVEAEGAKLEILSARADEAEEKAEDSNKALVTAKEEVRQIEKDESRLPVAANLSSAPTQVLVLDQALQKLSINLRSAEREEERARLQVQELTSKLQTTKAISSAETALATKPAKKRLPTEKPLPNMKPPPRMKPPPSEVKDSLLAIQAIQQKLQHALATNAGDEEVSALIKDVASATNHVKEQCNKGLCTQDKVRQSLFAIRAAQVKVKDALAANAGDAKLAGLLNTVADATKHVVQVAIKQGLSTIQEAQANVKIALANNATDEEVEVLLKRVADATQRVKKHCDEGPCHPEPKAATGGAQQDPVMQGLLRVQAAQIKVKDAISKKASEQEVAALLTNVQHAINGVKTMTSSGPGAADAQSLKRLKSKLLDAKDRLKDAHVRVVSAREKVKLFRMAKMQASIAALNIAYNHTAHNDYNETLLDSYHNAADAILRHASELKGLKSGPKKDELQRALTSAISALRARQRKESVQTPQEKILAEALVTAEDSVATDVHASGLGDIVQDVTLQMPPPEEENSAGVAPATLQTLAAVQRASQQVGADRSRLAATEKKVRALAAAVEDSHHKWMTANSTYSNAISNAKQAAAKALEDYNKAVARAAAVSDVGKLRLAIVAQGEKTKEYEEEVIQKSDELQNVEEEHHFGSGNRSLRIYELQANLKRHLIMKKDIEEEARTAIQKVNNLRAQPIHVTANEVDKNQNEDPVQSESAEPDTNTMPDVNTHDALRAAIAKAKEEKERIKTEEEEGKKAAKLALKGLVYAKQREHSAQEAIGIAQAQVNTSQSEVGIASGELDEQEQTLASFESLVKAVKKQLEVVTAAKHTRFEAQKALHTLQTQRDAAKYDAQSAQTVHHDLQSNADIKLATYHSHTEAARLQHQTAQAKLARLQTAHATPRMVHDAEINQNRTAEALEQARKAESELEVRLNQTLTEATERQSRKEQKYQQLKTEAEAAQRENKKAASGVSHALTNQEAAEQKLEKVEVQLRPTTDTADLIHLVQRAQNLKERIVEAKEQVHQDKAVFREKQAVQRSTQRTIDEIAKENANLHAAKSKALKSKNTLDLLRIQAAHAEKALEFLLHEKTNAEIETKQTYANAKANADKEIALARQKRINAARVARDTEVKLAYSMSQASSAEESVAHIKKAMDVAESAFQKAHKTLEETSAWKLFHKAKEHEIALQKSVAKLQDGMSHAGQLRIVKALVAAWKTNASQYELDDALHTAKLDLLEQKQKAFDTKQEQQLIRLNQDVMVDSEKAKEAALETGAGRAENAAIVGGAMVKSMRNMVTSVSNIKSQYMQKTKEAQKVVSTAQEHLTTILYTANSTTVQEAEKAVKAAQTKLNLDSSCQDALRATLTEHLLKTNVTESQTHVQLMNNLTDSVSLAERRDKLAVGHAFKKILEAKGAANSANKAQERIKVALMKVEQAEISERDAVQEEETLQAGADKLKEDQLEAREDVGREQEELSAGKQVLSARQHMLQTNKRISAELTNHLKLMNRAQEIAAEAHASAEEQYDTSEALLVPLLDVKAPTNQTKKDPRAQLKAMVNMARTVAQKAEALKEAADKQRYSMDVGVSEEKLASDQQMLMAAHRKTVLARQVETASAQSVEALNRDLADAISKWDKAKHRDFVAGTKSKLVSVTDKLRQAKTSVAQLERSVASRSAVPP
jgi:hypothetical protein